jgi:hypothetical protein
MHKYESHMIKAVQVEPKGFPISFDILGFDGPFLEPISHNTLEEERVGCPS